MSSLRGRLTPGQISFLKLLAFILGGIAVLAIPDTLAGKLPTYTPVIFGGAGLISKLIEEFLGGQLDPEIEQLQKMWLQYGPQLLPLLQQLQQTAAQRRGSEILGPPTAIPATTFPVGPVQTSSPFDQTFTGYGIGGTSTTAPVVAPPVVLPQAPPPAAAPAVAQPAFSNRNIQNPPDP